MPKKSTVPRTSNRAILSTEKLESNIETARPSLEALAGVLKNEEESNAEPEPGTVTVRVLRQPINEGCVHYNPGDTFETSAARAASLGGLVEVVS